MTDFRVIKETESSSGYCVPAALSAVTGRTVEDICRLLRSFTGRPVRSINRYTYERALFDLGYRMTITKKDSLERLRLAEWMALDREPQAACLLSIQYGHTRHLVALRGDTLVDNLWPNGIHVEQYPHRRAQVKLAFKVEAIQSVE